MLLLKIFFQKNYNLHHAGKIMKIKCLICTKYNCECLKIYQSYILNFKSYSIKFL